MLKKSILVVTSAHPAGWLNDGSDELVRAMHGFKKVVEGKGAIQLDITTIDALRFTVDNDGVSIVDTYNDQDISYYDSVHFKNVAHYWDFAKAIANYMHKQGKSTFELVDEGMPDYGKLSQMVLFDLNGVAVPITYAAWRLDDVVLMLKEQNTPFPWVIKSIKGIMGKDNYLVGSDADLVQIPVDGVQYIGQPFIPNDSDYRILYFGMNQDPLVFKKVSQGDSHLNNTSQGGQSYLVENDEFYPEVLAMAEKAALLTKRLFAGVDAMENKETGEWVILEVNANPALMTGAFVENKADMYEQMITEEL